MKKFKIGQYTYECDKHAEPIKGVVIQYASSIDGKPIVRKTEFTIDSDAMYLIHHERGYYPYHDVKLLNDTLPVTKTDNPYLND